MMGWDNQCILNPTLTLHDFDNALSEHPLFGAGAQFLPELTSFIMGNGITPFVEDILYEQGNSINVFVISSNKFSE
jgi:hypothetical protein